VSWTREKKTFLAWQILRQMTRNLLSKLLIKLNCLPCVFASPDAPTMANSKDNRRWEQQEDFGFPKRKILQPQQQFSWLATANYDGIFTFGLVKCAANLVYEIL